ncbi:hypothetical protein AAG747_07540 [Rapidithrix thailandica]|uniref:MarA n=1 Tax=Rapidithrix thailandica TaxID=413964 RepID=A0A494WDD2_9BACT|nr:MarA [Rapidithrix thailandica]
MSELVTSTTLLDETYVEIFIDSENKVIVARWKGFLKSDQMEKGMNTLINNISKKGITKHLSDHTELKVLSSDLQKRLVEDGLPAFERVGITKLAVKTADDIFAVATVEKVNNTTQIGKMTIKSFNTDQQCLDWLNE